MTAKDYRRIAAALRKSQPADAPEKGHPAWKTWDDTMVEIAFTLREENPRFDTERFREACLGPQVAALWIEP